MNYKKSGRIKKYSVDDIEGFIFGGFNSRFWLMKNYINMIKPDKLTDEMLCWNMISIKIKGEQKQCNLVLKNESEMDILIQMLLRMMHQNAMNIKLHTKI